MRKMVVLVATFALVAALAAPSAQAHTLSLVKAHSASVKAAGDVCDVIADQLTCTGTHVETCQRISAHKVRCQVELAVTLVDEQIAGTCSYTDQWSLKPGSRQLHWSPAVFDQTLACV